MPLTGDFRAVKIRVDPYLPEGMWYMESPTQMAWNVGDEIVVVDKPKVSIYTRSEFWHDRDNKTS